MTSYDQLIKNADISINDVIDNTKQYTGNQRTDVVSAVGSFNTALALAAIADVLLAKEIRERQRDSTYRFGHVGGADGR